MKRILFFLSLLPYLASAQVAKDTVTVLTPAQITAASPNDTANIYFVIANAWRKANFDSIARYTRTRFQTLTLDSTHIAANGISLQGTELTGTLPVSRGGTGNTTGLAATATALATGRTIQTNLASTSSATFNGTANITPGVTGTLPVGNGGTGTNSQFTAGSVVFAGTSGVYTENSNNFTYNNSSTELSLGVNNTSVSGSGNRLRLHNSGFRLTSDNVDHGMVGLAPTNAYFTGSFVSDINGGALFRGLSDGDSGDSPGLWFEGTVTNASSKGSINFKGAKKSGSTFQALTGTEIVMNFENLNTSLMRFLGNGNVGVGVVAPTAVLHLKAGTATANTAPLKFTSGTNLDATEAGTMEYNGTNLFFTPASTRHTINQGLTGSATLDFASTNAQNSRDLTITVTGASDGDVVSLGVPNGSVNANTCFTAWVSASNTVTVRFNNYSSGSVDPASGTFKVFVTKF